MVSLCGRRSIDRSSAVDGLMGIIDDFLFCSDVRTTYTVYSYVLVRCDPVSRVEIDGSRSVPNQ